MMKSVIAALVLLFCTSFAFASDEDLVVVEAHPTTRAGCHPTRHAAQSSR
jgi:hypothetical protein